MALSPSHHSPRCCSPRAVLCPRTVSSFSPRPSLLLDLFSGRGTHRPAQLHSARRRHHQHHIPHHLLILVVDTGSQHKTTTTATSSLAIAPSRMLAASGSKPGSSIPAPLCIRRLLRARSLPTPHLQAPAHPSSTGNHLAPVLSYPLRSTKPPRLPTSLPTCIRLSCPLFHLPATAPPHHASPLHRPPPRPRHSRPTTVR